MTNYKHRNVKVLLANSIMHAVLIENTIFIITPEKV